LQREKILKTPEKSNRVPKFTDMRLTEKLKEFSLCVSNVSLAKKTKRTFGGKMLFLLTWK